MSHNIKEYNKQRRRTKDGLISCIYATQLASSRKRNHPKPTYTNQELNQWIKSHNHFDYIFNKWVGSGYEKNKRPSVDRINDTLPYMPNNIRLTTWEHNNRHGHKNRRDGIALQGSLCKPVKQYKNGVLVGKYYSISEAKRATDINHISCACSGKRCSAGGYTWEYGN